MLVKQKFVRKPFNVTAVQVTAENMAELSKWCKGAIRHSAGPGGRNPQKYIKVPVKRPLNDRQTQAYVGDWVVTAANQKNSGFKVYTPKAFTLSFDEIVDDMIETLEQMNKRANEEERMEEEGLFPEELTYSNNAQH